MKERRKERMIEVINDYFLGKSIIEISEDEGIDLSSLFLFFINEEEKNLIDMMNMYKDKDTLRKDFRGHQTEEVKYLHDVLYKSVVDDIFKDYGGIIINEEQKEKEMDIMNEIRKEIEIRDRYIKEDVEDMREVIRDIVDIVNELNTTKLKRLLSVERLLEKNIINDISRIKETDEIIRMIKVEDKVRSSIITKIVLLKVLYLFRVEYTIYFNKEFNLDEEIVLNDLMDGYDIYTTTNKLNISKRKIYDYQRNICDNFKKYLDIILNKSDEDIENSFKLFHGLELDYGGDINEEE